MFFNSLTSSFGGNLTWISLIRQKFGDDAVCLYLYDLIVQIWWSDDWYQWRFVAAGRVFYRGSSRSAQPLRCCCCCCNCYTYPYQQAANKQVGFGLAVAARRSIPVSRRTAISVRAATLDWLPRYFFCLSKTNFSSFSSLKLISQMIDWVTVVGLGALCMYLFHLPLSVAPCSLNSVWLCSISRFLEWSAVRAGLERSFLFFQAFKMRIFTCSQKTLVNFTANPD